MIKITKADIQRGKLIEIKALIKKERRAQIQDFVFLLTCAAFGFAIAIITFSRP